MYSVCKAAADLSKMVQEFGKETESETPHVNSEKRRL